MSNPLANLARILIACNDPNVMRRVFERFAINNPEALIEAGSIEGIGTEVIKVADCLDFSVRFVDIKVYKEAEEKAKAGLKVEAIKIIRAGTGAGLKEAKDFVEHYFPYPTNYGRTGY